MKSKVIAKYIYIYIYIKNCISPPILQEICCKALSNNIAVIGFINRLSNERKTETGFSS